MPSPPVRQYSFTDWQVNNPTAPPPGDRMDAEYDRGNQSISDTITWASVSLNTDGSLRDGIVGQNNLVSGLFDDVAQGIIDQVQPLVDQAQSYASAAAGSSSTAQASATAADVSNTAAQVAASTAQSSASSAGNQALAAGTSALAAQNAAADAANAANDAAGDLALSSDYGLVTQAWAEHMPDTIPPNILAVMNITGDHWSSRWWANKASNAFGQLSELYLGVHPAPPTSTSTGDVIPIGAIYYNSTSNQPFIWDGTEWVPFFTPTKAYLLTLLYRATAGQTAFPLTTLDLGSNSYTLSAVDTEPLEVYVDGDRLPQDEPNPGYGYWTVNGATSTITFLKPLNAGQLVQVDIMSSVSTLAPSRVQTQALLDFNIDPATGNPGQIDGTKKTFPLAFAAAGYAPVSVGSAQELFVSLDGVVQQPGIDFNTSGATITFLEPPVVGARTWATWYGPGLAGSGPGVGYLPISGGVLTGPLTLAGMPTQSLHAATKSYVDTHAPTGGSYLPLTGGTMTGPLNYTATGGTALRSAQDRGGSFLTVEDFGAVGDGSADCSDAFDAYAAYLRAQITTGKPQHAWVLGFGRVYFVTRSIDLTMFSEMRFEGNNSRIVSNEAAHPCIDMLGSDYCVLANVQLLCGTQAAPAKVGIAYGVFDDVQGHSNVTLENVEVNGFFLAACVQNSGSEVNLIHNPILTNQYTSGTPGSSYCLIQDGEHHWDLNSRYVTDTRTRGYYYSFLGQEVVGGSFQHVGDGSCLWNACGSQHHFRNTYMQVTQHVPCAVLAFNPNPAGNIKDDFIWEVNAEIGHSCVFFITGSGDVFFGGFTMRNPPLSVANDGFVFLADPATVSWVRLMDVDLQLPGFVNAGTKVFNDPTLFSINGRVHMQSAAFGNWNGAGAGGYVELMTDDGSGFNAGLYALVADENGATLNIEAVAAGSLTAAGGTLHNLSLTGNPPVIDFNASGYGPPTFTTRSAGTKLSLYSSMGSTTTDIAIGVDANTMWFSGSTTSNLFKWYGGTTLAATLSGAGALALVGGLTCVGGTFTGAFTGAHSYSGAVTFSGGLNCTGSQSLTLPAAAKTGTAYTVAATDCSLILNPTGTFTLTLPAASANTGRVIRLKLIAAFAVNSASANIVQLIGGTATAAIMPATSGKFCLLQSDGTNWQLMQAN
jgi:hypothetical protein